MSQSKIQTFIPLYADGISGYVFVGSDDDLIPGCNGSISGDGSINVFFSSATDCSFSATVRYCLELWQHNSLSQSPQKNNWKAFLLL